MPVELLAPLLYSSELVLVVGELLHPVLRAGMPGDLPGRVAPRIAGPSDVQLRAFDTHPVLGGAEARLTGLEHEPRLTVRDLLLAVAAP